MQRAMRTAINWTFTLTLAAVAACAGKGTPPGAPGAGAAKAMKMDGPVWTNKATIEARCDAGLAEAEAQRTTLKSGATGDKTLVVYNDMLIALDGTFGLMALMASTHPVEVVRNGAEACERRVQALISEINLDRGLYDAVSKVELANVDDQAKRFVKKVLREFRRSGVDKDEATRARLKELHAKMVEVGQTFGRNIRDDVRKIYVDDADALKGLPADWIKAHAPNAEGKIEITTNYPDYFPIQNYAEDASLRRELVIKFLSRGHPKNEAVLGELLKLRKEYASLLGFDSWADYNAEDKMVKTADAIGKFVAEIDRIARPRMTRDLGVLLERKKKDEADAKAIETWDRFFYVGKVRSETYGFDAQTVRPYFEYNRVTKGLMDLYGELFGVEFFADETAPVWHPSVRAYKLKSGGETIARFYLDMHPRDGKYKHAAMFPIETGLTDGRVPVGALVCNFPDPGASEGPALMEHTQVVTYFHEFGHLVHHLLARGSTWVNQAGINVEWDFVEAPSQLLEEWAWDPAVLARFAKHIETDEPISADVVKKMRASSEFGKGVHIMRQLFYTALSYELHQADPAKVDLTAFTRDIQQRYMPYPFIEGTHTYAGFGHLDGYSSMYYTYQWSLVLAKDIFTRFSQAGLLDAKVAQDYREKILAPGGTKDAAQLVQDFLGRESNLQAYRKWLESE